MDLLHIQRHDIAANLERPPSGPTSNATSHPPGRSDLALRVSALLVSVALAGSVAGCDTADPADTSLGMITHVVDAIDAQEWSPAHRLPDAEREAIGALLTDKSLVMLFPTPAPVADPDATEARFSAQTYLPEDRSSASLWVAAGDLGLSLQVYAVGQSCAERMAGDSFAGTDMSWSPGQIRGHDACVAVGTPPAVSFLEWDEAGVRFAASWKGLTLEEVQTWLSQWTQYPEASDG